MEVVKLRQLLGVDNSKDLQLEFILNDVEETILNYCNVEAVPQGLEHTAYRMAIDLYRAESIGESDTPLVVTSVSVGGTSTGFSNSSESIKETLLKDYKKQLNRYRKLGW